MECASSKTSSTSFSYEKLEKEENALKEVFLGLNDVVNSPEFDGFLQEKLAKTYEDFANHLKEREDDLFRRDCGILVVGDTSTGKSTLINVLLEEKILETDIFACTKKIFKIIRSDSIEVKTYSAGKTPLNEYPNITSLQELKSVLKEIAAEDVENETTLGESFSDDTESTSSDSSGSSENADKSKQAEAIFEYTVGPSGTNEGEVYEPKYTTESVYNTSKYRNYQESTLVDASSSSVLDQVECGFQSTSIAKYSDTCASDYLETSLQNILAPAAIATKSNNEAKGMSEISEEGIRGHVETSEERSRGLLETAKAPDKSSEGKSDRQICREVEIFYPSPKLKGNIMIVDSPGFGESEELDHRLRDYIQSAVSFIFVTDVNRGGGLQKDGILRLLNEIKQCQVNMFSFDPSDVIFVSNKWDTMLSDDKRYRKEIKRKIKEAWPSIKKDHIFFLSAGRVDKSKNDKYFREYKKFEKVILEVLEANENKRAKTQYRFLEDFFLHLVRIVMPRYHSLFKDEEENNNLLDETRSKLDKLSNSCAEMEKKHSLRFQGHLRDLTNKVHLYLQTDEFKEKILSQENMEWTSLPKEKIGSEVTKRIEEETKQKIEIEAEEFVENDMKDILLDYDKIKREIHEIDTQLSGLRMPYNIERNIPFSVFKFEDEALGGMALVGAISGMRHGPNVGLLIGAGCLCVLVFKHLTKAWQLAGPNDAIARRVFTESISSTDVTKIRKLLDEGFGTWYHKIISRLFTHVIPGEIYKMKLSIYGLEHEITVLRSKQQDLLNLKLKLDEVRSKLNSCFKLLFE